MSIAVWTTKHRREEPYEATAVGRTGCCSSFISFSVGIWCLTDMMAGGCPPRTILAL